MAIRAAVAAFAAKQGIVQALRHRDFAIWTGGNFISIAGFWVMRIGLGWFAWELTQSGVWLGVVALAQAVPAAIAGPFAGAMADRMDRLHLMKIIQLASAAFAAVLAFMTAASLVNEYVLTAMAIVYGALFAFGLAARGGIGPNLVPKEDMPASIAVNSVMYGSGAFVGPAIAGLCISGVGIAATFALNAISFLVMYVCLFFIRLTRHEHRRGAHSGLGREVVAGIRYAAAHAGIGPIIVLAIVTATFVRSLPDLLPGFVDVAFGRGVEGLAILVSAFGLGALVGAVWMANRNRVTGATTIMLVGAVGSACLTIALTVTSDFHAAVGLMCLIGFSGAMWQNASQILIQNAVDGAMRARVMSLYLFNFGSAPALGAMMLGALSTFIEFSTAIALGSILAFVVLIRIVQRSGRIRRAVEEEIIL
ncbi:MAG: transporter [Rhodospirillales bacterium]|nr:transporter [Rhodospirillales bacterium]